MKEPISISIDRSAGIGYVRFRELAEGECAHARRIESHRDVVVDRDAEGAIVGIELLQLTSETQHAAAAYAQEHDLAFPQHLDAL